MASPSNAASAKMQKASDAESRRKELEKKGRLVMGSKLMDGMQTGFTKRVEVPRKELPLGEVRRRVELLWEYLSLLSEKPAKSYEEWLEWFETDLNPESQSFYWETMVLSCIDVLYLQRYIDNSLDSLFRGIPEKDWMEYKSLQLALLRTINTTIPTEDVIKHDLCRKLWRILPRDQRDDIYRYIKPVVGLKPEDTLLLDRKRLRNAMLAVMRVTESRTEKCAKVDKLKYERYGAHFTMLCAQCQKSGENFKKCAACRSVHYCSKECQLTHWKVHKKECSRVKKSKASGS